MLDRHPIRALLFDIDGTLSDTDDQYVQYLYAKLQHFMAPDTARRLARRLVMNLETPLNKLYEWADRLYLDEVWKKMSRTPTLRRPLAPFQAIPGIEQTLQQLHTFFQLAIVSARGQHGTLAFLEQFGLQPFFKTVVTAHSCRKSKPHPEPLLLAASRLNVHPAECIMIGDTVMDIRAGKAAGCQTIGVLCGFGTQQELAAAGADMLLASTAEVADYLLP